MPKSNINLVIVVGLIVILLILYWRTFKPMFIADEDLEPFRMKVADRAKNAEERAAALLEERLPEEVRQDIIFRSTSLKNFLASHDRNNRAEIDLKLDALKNFHDFLEDVYEDMLEGNFRFF